MYRRGPSKSTPANVQCQKCLKRGHYSYECKASTQERPYIARPSRTQQLLNPKLVPKLTSDTADAQKNTKGLADQVLAKREAERAKEQESEQDDDIEHGVSKRQRSASYDSISTVSTRASGSPARRRASVSPQRSGRAIHSPSPARESSRKRSFDSRSDYEGRHSPSPRGRNRGTRSPEPTRQRMSSSSRSVSPRRGRFTPEEKSGRRNAGRRRGRYSESPSRSPPPSENRRRFRSRSPRGPWRSERSPPPHNDRPAAPHRGSGREQRGAQGRSARERSLSPFSKRLALTQSMNTDR